MNNWYQHFLRLGRNNYFRRLSALRGEWWIHEYGYAQFADGDVGDLNHEAACIQDARGLVLGAFGIDSELYDWEEEKSNICKEHMDELENEGNEEGHKKAYESYEFNPDGLFEELALAEGVEQGTLNIAQEHGDVRALAMKHWGHKRLVGTYIETYALTLKDLEAIKNGVWEAYGWELENAEATDRDPEFTLEVTATRSMYNDIPWSVLSKGDLKAISGYRDRY